ncbi:MAG: hypothetical protein MUP33_10730, partial [Polaromonas sp.]|nr:hypothetical protein [Polaromonas sp.]
MEPIHQIFLRRTLLIAAFLTATLLAACGGGGGSTAPVADTPVVTIDAVAPTAISVGIGGTAQVGQLLTGIYTY